MEKILKLFNRIDIHLQSKNTQEIILDLGESEKAKERMAATQIKLDEEIKQLQEWLDDPESAEYISENLDVFTETFDSIYLALDLNIDKLKANAVGKEELYLHLQKLIAEKASTQSCSVPYVMDDSNDEDDE